MKHVIKDFETFLIEAKDFLPSEANNLDVYKNIIKKYLSDDWNEAIINKLAEVCLHARYFEQDIAELCKVLQEK
jgi:hypothetical protein